MGYKGGAEERGRVKVFIKSMSSAGIDPHSTGSGWVTCMPEGPLMEEDDEEGWKGRGNDSNGTKDGSGGKGTKDGSSTDRKKKTHHDTKDDMGSKGLKDGYKDDGKHGKGGNGRDSSDGEEVERLFA